MASTHCKEHSHSAHVVLMRNRDAAKAQGTNLASTISTTIGEYMHTSLAQPKCFPFVLFQDHATFQNLKQNQRDSDKMGSDQMAKFNFDSWLSVCQYLSDLMVRKGLLVLKVSDRALGFRDEGNERGEEKEKMWQHNIMILWLLQGSVVERGC